MITIPEHFWNAMLGAFARDRRPVEQVCYFDGIIDGAGGGVVTTLTIPNAQLYPQRFEVPPESMSQAGRHFRAYRLKRLAQVHTHPTEWTGHSPWDDQKAYSQLTGAISIVLPHFARRQPTLADSGVHIRTAAGWRRLAAAEVEAHMRLVPSMLDFRPSVRSKHAETQRADRLESTRGKPWWKALLFWQR